MSLQSAVHPTAGFHPTSHSTISVSPALQRRNHTCSLFLYYHLPPLVFVDPYELAQRSAAYTFKRWGESDLEKPVFAMPDEESHLLLDVHLKTATEDRSHDIHVEVPMHLRYGVPTTGDIRGEGDSARLDWPTALLGCSGQIPDVPSTSPQDYLPNFVFDSLRSSTPDGEFFVPIPPTPKGVSAWDIVRVPVGSKGDLPLVESGTALVIIVSFLWMVCASWRTAARLHPLDSTKQE